MIDAGSPGARVAELDAADVLVEELLHALHVLPALLRIAFLGEGFHGAVFFVEAPPPRPLALERRRERRLGREREAGREDVEQLGLVPALHERGPVDDLQIDLEPDLLELLLGDERVLVHPLVFLRRHPAHRLAGVSRVLQELLCLRLVLLVVVLAGDLRVPLGLLDEHHGGIQPVEILVTEPGRHDRLHVERRLERLPESPVGHQPLLVVQDRGRPGRRFDHEPLHVAHRPHSIVLVLLDLLREVILARLDARQPHRHVRDRDEEDLVEVRGALAAVAVGRLRSPHVVLEAHQLEVPVGLVLDEAIRPGPDKLLDLPVASGIDDFLGIDGRPVARPSQSVQQRGGGLFQIDDDLVRSLRLDGFHELPQRLARRRHLSPARERGHDVGGGHLLAVVKLDAAAELERVAASPVQRRPALGQHRDRVVLAVVRVEVLVDVPGDLLRDRRRRRVQVERGRLADHRRLEDAARARLLLGPEVSSHEEHRERHDDTERGFPDHHVTPRYLASQLFQKYRRGAVRNSPRSSRRAMSSVL